MYPLFKKDERKLRAKYNFNSLNRLEEETGEKVKQQTVWYLIIPSIIHSHTILYQLKYSITQNSLYKSKDHVKCLTEIHELK